MRLTAEDVTRKWKQVLRVSERAIAEAATGAMRDLAETVQAEGRANILGARFPIEWAQGFTVKAYPTRGRSSGHPVAYARHRFNFAQVFESGARISAGFFLLWLPLDDVPKIGNKPMSPNQFFRAIGPLHLITPRGRDPMLAAYAMGAPGARVTRGKLRRGGALALLGVRAQRGRTPGRGIISVPMYVGVDSVTIRARWHLTAIYERARERLPEWYEKRIQQEQGRIGSATGSSSRQGSFGF